MLALLVLLPLLVTVNGATLARRETNVQIQSARDGKCLDTAFPFHFNGTSVISAPCQGAATWTIDRGSGSIILGGFDGQFALDAGSSPHNNGGLKVWQTYPGLFQQTWYWTNDNRIAITGGDQCLDEGDNGVQTYKCTTGNTNQVWNIITAGSTTTTTTTSVPTSTASAIPSGTVYPDPAGGGGRRIHWNDREDLCLTIIAQDLERDPADGTPVGLAYCLPLDSPNVRMQLWDLPCPGGTQQLNLHGGGTCLTAGTIDDGLLPGDGTPLTIRKCLNEPVQSWKFESDAVQFCIGNGFGQCFNVVKDSKPGNQTPIQSLRNLQTWRAGPSDPQSKFFVSPLSAGPHDQC